MHADAISALRPKGLHHITCVYLYCGSPRGLDWTGSGSSRCAVALVGVPLILIVVMHFLLVGVVCLGDRHLARITALKADAK